MASPTAEERARRRVDWPIDDQPTRVRVNQAEDDLNDIDARVEKLVTGLNRIMWALVTLCFSLVSVAVTIIITGGGG